MSDNSDYVYIYLVGDMDFQRKQEIDLFGLVSGVTVSPVRIIVIQRPLLVSLIVLTKLSLDVVCCRRLG